MTLHCPDFNEPDFATLTMTRMLEQLDREMARRDRHDRTGGARDAHRIEPRRHARDSRGGRFRRARRSPGAAGSGRHVREGGHHLLPPERIAEWRRLGRLPFFHYADNAERMLNFAFYEDSFRYNPFDATFSQPTLIFQGTKDASVDPRTVEAFARVRPNVTLSLLDDDHQLTGSLPRIWDGVSAFLEMK